MQRKGKKHTTEYTEKNGQINTRIRYCWRFRYSLFLGNHVYRNSMNSYIIITIFIILIIVQNSRRRIVTKFYQTETLSLATAKLFNEVGVADRVYTKVLIYRGIIKDAENNRFFLDQSRISELERHSLTILKYITVAAIVFLTGVVLYLLLR